MLTSLHIENIAVIEKNDILFGSGLNILTGETGAGKSIIIDAINAVLGERTSRELIRTGAESGLVSAEFSDVSAEVKDVLNELGIPSDDDVVIISRKISFDGKNFCRVNGAPANVAILKQLGAYLINIHGQHDSQFLLSPDKHIGFIDKYADNELLLRTYRQEYSVLCTIRNQIKDLTAKAEDNQRRADLLRFEVEELSAAQIEVGEQQKLTARRDIIRNSENIARELSEVRGMLSGDEDNPDLSWTLKKAADKLDGISKFFPQYEEQAERLRYFSYEIEDAVNTVSDGLSKIDYDPNLLERIEERLDYLYRLSLKYGMDEQQMLARLEESERELDLMDNSARHISKLKEQFNDQYKRTMAAAEKLSLSREKASKSIEEKICVQLAFLDMPKTKFIVNAERTDFTENGIDKMEFLISPNVGEDPKPLSKIASGGELSRIMLAIRSILADKDAVDTLIFDEIDTGISGSAAQKVGEQMHQLSAGCQVICVTHLAQIAAMADHHYLIEKSVSGAKTYTQVTLLDDAQRVREVARIISPGELTESSLAFARELIDRNGK